MEKNKKKGKKEEREREEDRAHESVVQDEEKDDVLKMICCAYGLKMVIFGVFLDGKLLYEWLFFYLPRKKGV